MMKLRSNKIFEDLPIVKKYYNSRETAVLLGYSWPYFINYMVKAYKIPHAKSGTGYLLFPKTKVDKWVVEFKKRREVKPIREIFTL